MGAKYQIPVDQFRSVLSVAKAYTQTRGLIPVLGSFCFINDQVMTSNGKAGFRAALGWKAGEPGIALEAARLASLLGMIPGEKVLTVEVGDEAVKIFCESFQATFTARSVADFPVVEEPKKRSPFPEGVWEAAQQLYFSVSQDETKQALRGIQVSGSEKHPAAYSSDGYRMSRIALRAGFKGPLLIPDILLAPIITHASPPTGYALSDALLWIYFEECCVHGSLLAEKFPEVENFFVQSRKSIRQAVQVVFDNDSLQQALGRLLLFSTDVLQRVVVAVSPGSETATVSAQGDAGSAQEKVILEHVSGFEGRKEVMIHVNGKFLGDAAANARTCFIGGPTDPLYFLNKESGFEHLLLPLHQG